VKDKDLTPCILQSSSYLAFPSLHETLQGYSAFDISILGTFIVQNVDFDRILCAISCRLQSMYRFFECKDMADQGIQVDIPRLQKPNSVWPGVVIAIDEFQVNLPIWSLVNPVSIATTLDCKKEEGLTSARERCINGNPSMMSFPTPTTITVPPL